mmetsp:Transcript_12617/g.27291  ORF Transcript_12617/g.27291 Transcript_12617/m.27291 type:complete len:2302 (-) Transcript_12617:1765-8670(-)
MLETDSEVVDDRAAADTRDSSDTSSVTPTAWTAVHPHDSCKAAPAADVLPNCFPGASRRYQPQMEATVNTKGNNAFSSMPSDAGNVPSELNVAALAYSATSEVDTVHARGCGSSRHEGMAIGTLSDNSYSGTVEFGAHDGSELFHFIPRDICSFFKSTLGIRTIQQFASADRYEVARNLLPWYHQKAKGGVSPDVDECARPLKYVEAQVYTWMLQMNKLRERHSLPPLPTRNGPNSSAKGDSSALERTGDNAKESSVKRKSNDRKKRKLPTDLVGKKEALLAKSVLGITADLATVLPIGECRFLGDNFWIFSVQQLEWVLVGLDDPGAEPSCEVKRSHLIEKIVEETANSLNVDANASAGLGDNSVAELDVGMAGTNRSAAEALVLTWKKKLDDRKSANKAIPRSESLLRVIFPLGGAVSTLFPPAFLQFLQCAGITTAYDFLSAKKTENSRLVGMFLIWREKHMLKVAKPAVVARFMLSVSARVHTALSVVPPVNSFTRDWTGCNLQALTGAAREFVIFECRFSKDSDFLNNPTKDLAKRLAKFREAKGMPVLKGTGNVATISGWKSLVKDTGDVEESLLALVPDIPFDMKALLLAKEEEDSARMGPVEKRQKPSTQDRASVTAAPAPAPAPVLGPGTPTRSTGCSDPTCSKSKPEGVAGASISTAPTKSPEPDLSPSTSIPAMRECSISPSALSPSLRHSSAILEEVLKPSQFKFLSAAGITTADKLIRADKSEQSSIIQKLARWRRERGFDEIDASLLVKAISQWTSKVQTRLDTQKPEDRNEKSKDTITKPPRKSKKNKRRTLPKKFEANSGLDPIEALSKMAKDFLMTEGIATAQQFLSRRTSDLAAAFIAWRELQGLVALKGFGAVSIMSGWKGVVRDTCRAIGESELVEIDRTVRGKRPKHGAASSKADAAKGRSYPRGERKKPREAERDDEGKVLSEQETSGFDSLPVVEDTACSHPSILNGLPSRVFTVCSYGRDPILYDFELSVHELGNQSSTSSQASSGVTAPGCFVSLTYRGARTRETKKNDAISRCTVTPVSFSSSFPRNYAVLHKYSGEDGDYLSKSNEGFCSLYSPGNGGGLIDLSGFHLFPLLVLGDRAKRTQKQVERFVSSEAYSEPQLPAATTNGEGCELGHTEPNVFTILDATSGRRRIILCLSESIEKGQTMRLQLANDLVAPTDHEYDLNVASRASLSDAIESLSASDLDRVLAYVEENLLSKVESRIESFLKEGKKTCEGGSGILGSNSSDAKELHTTEIVGKSPRLSLKDATKELVARRRLHAIGSVIISHVQTLLKEERLIKNDRDTFGDITSRADKLLWDRLSVDAANFIQQEKESDGCFSLLCEEVSDEVQYNVLSERGSLVARCPLSWPLESEILRMVSVYCLTTIGSNTGTKQQALTEGVVRQTKSVAEDLLSSAAGRTKADILRLVLCPENTLALDGHMNCLPDAFCIPTYHISTISGLAFDSIVKAAQQQREDPKAIATYRHEIDSFVVVKAESGERSLTLGISLNIASESDVQAVLDCLKSSSRHFQLSIDFTWYLYNQVLGVVDGIVSSTVKWLRPIHDLCVRSYSLTALKKSVCSSLGLATAVGEADIECPPDSKRAPVYVMLRPNDTLIAATQDCYYPNTLTVFLRVIWPILEEKFGWKIHAGRTAATPSFLPPESASKRHKVVSVDNAESTRRRRKISRRMTLANIPKLPRNLKQIFVKFVGLIEGGVESDADAGMRKSSQAAQPKSNSRSVKDAIEAFAESIDCKDDKRRTTTMKGVGRTLLAMFDEMVPILFPMNKVHAPSKEVSDATGSDDSPGQRASDLYGCEYLIWCLVVLPDVLTQSGMPLREQEIIEVFVEALLLYLSKHSLELFDEDVYQANSNDEEDEIDVSRRMRDALDKVSTESKETTLNDVLQEEIDPRDLAVVREHEIPLLTDFAVYALRQVQICFAREEDLSSGKRSGFRVGAPGLICVWCMKNSDERTSRSFFSNQSSIATSPSQIFIHCQRCPHCPEEVLANLVSAKQRHANQKKSLEYGSQARFYNNLFKRMTRMRRSNTGGVIIQDSLSEESSDDDDTSSVNAAEAAEEGNCDDADEIFDDHIQVTRFLVENKFYQRPEITSAIELYFQCLNLGGKLWNTGTVPVELSRKGASEYIFKQIVKQMGAEGEIMIKAPGKVKATTAPPASPTDNEGGIKSKRHCSVAGCVKFKQQDSDGMCRSHFVQMKNNAKKTTNKTSSSSAASINGGGSGSGSVNASTENLWSCHACAHLNPPERKRCTGCTAWRGGKRPGFSPTGKPKQEKQSGVKT